jgi:hypothetical protein
VYFGYVPGYVDIASQWVRLNSTQIVVGLANAWTPTMLAPPPVGANQSRQAVLLPSELATAHAALGANNGTTPRGYMFWGARRRRHRTRSHSRCAEFADAMGGCGRAAACGI